MPGGHFDVEHDNVGGCQFRQKEKFFARFGFGSHTDVVALAFDIHPYPHSEHGMVVNYDYAYH